MADFENQITLGKRLRQISDNAKSAIEIKNFTECLENVAASGKTSIQFPDLRQYLGTMCVNGTVMDWLKSQDLVATGGADQNTGNWVVTISW